MFIGRRAVLGSVWLLGWLLIATAIVLLLPGALMLGQGVNDAEFGHLARTGHISSPEAIHWSEWKQNDGSVHPFSFSNLREISEFRVGVGHGLLLDFVAYEGKGPDGKITPAVGPRWGARYHFAAAVGAGSTGVLLLFLALVFRRGGKSPPNPVLMS